MKYREAVDYAMLCNLRTNVYRYWIYDSLAGIGMFLSWEDLWEL